MKQFIFIVPSGTEPLDLAGPLQVFLEAKKLGVALESHFVSILTDNCSSTDGSGLTYSNLKPFNNVELNEGDYLFIPGVAFSELEDINFKFKYIPFFKWLSFQNEKR